MRYEIKNILCITAIMCLLLAAPSHVWALFSGTVEVRVSDGNDDVEQHGIDNSIYFDSSDLELVNETTSAGEAAARMTDKRIGCLVVQGEGPDADQQPIMGLFSETDLVRKVMATDQAHEVDRTDRRDLSIFRLGWDFIERCLALDDPIPIAFVPNCRKVSGG